MRKGCDNRSEECKLPLESIYSLEETNNLALYRGAMRLFFFEIY